METAIDDGVSLAPAKVKGRYKAVHDVPFVTVNLDQRTGWYEGEIVTSEDDAVTQARIREIQEVGHRLGLYCWASKPGDLSNVIKFFFAPVEDDVVA